MVFSEALVKCDGCGLLASEMLVNDSAAGPIATGSRVSGDFIPADPVATVAEMFKRAMPIPETRTERLLRAYLTQFQSLSTDPADDARIAVSFIRALEQELDSVPVADEARSPVTREGGGFSLKFASRETFVMWLLRGLDYAKECMGEEGTPNDFNINRAAKYLADWIEE